MSLIFFIIIHMVICLALDGVIESSIAYIADFIAVVASFVVALITFFENGCVGDEPVIPDSPPDLDLVWSKSVAIIGCFTAFVVSNALSTFAYLFFARRASAKIMQQTVRSATAIPPECDLTVLTSAK